MIRRHANNAVPFYFEKSVKNEKGKNDDTYFFILSSEVSKNHFCLFHYHKGI